MQTVGDTESNPINKIDTNKTQSVPEPTQQSTQQPNPQIELPKGGGAIRGISEKFSANPITGTSSLSIPLPISPARGFQPELTLAYDSGRGNSAYGLGWDIDVASIVRKTDKGLPTYDDRSDKDTFSLSGAEDLVPFLSDLNGRWTETINNIELQGKTWQVKLYRPRIEGSFSKIERWLDPETNIIWWRTVSTANVTTVYGFNEQACVYQPNNRAKTFRWMIDFVYDDKGHFTQYCYKRENHVGVPFEQACEQHRKGEDFAQLYLKKVLYGIKNSRFKSGYSDADLYRQAFHDRARDFHFQTVFDYGDHSEGSTSPTADVDHWPARKDAFSNYKAGFEIRTYRRCRRVMLFHDFPELGNHPELINSLNFEVKELDGGFSFLSSVHSTGYKRDGNGVMQHIDMPKMEFEYQRHSWNKKLHTVDPQSLENIPAGVDGQNYQWVDLYNEGLSGVLTEQAGALYYKQNLGAATFARAEPLSVSPSLKGFANGWTFQDLEANGIKSLVSSNGTARGYYDFDGEQHWQNFMPFKQVPNIAFDDPNLKIIDLNGDGRADILITEESGLRWYPSEGKNGFSQAEFSMQPDGAAEIIFANQSESIFTADMTGDGLTDIVRIRNGCVEYWPNKGFGNFGKKVTMSDAPNFNHPDLFTDGHIRLADLDGSGTNDIIYLGKNEFRYWLNNSGNSWSAEYETVNPFPEIDNLSTISVMDLLGTGTACVVWSTSLPGHKDHCVRYIDLMASQKPHLLKSYKNGFGKTTNFEYTPSTQFYLADKANGEPWITKLHFPVHCLSKVESIDHISGARFASSYSYHHGYYDHADREFRGFGRVDQIDTEDFEHFVKSGASNVQERVLHQSPVLTKTWFHNGAYLDQQRIVTQYQTEYFQHDNVAKYSLSKPELPSDLDPIEWREAMRACKGMALRTETYGLDGTDSQDIPFSVSYNTCTIRRIQPKKENKYTVFQVLNTETMSLTLDRKPDDPRISHKLLLETNEYGQPILSALISYGRKPTGLANPVSEQQEKTHCVISRAEYTNDLALFGDHGFDQFDDVFRAQTAWKNSTFEYGIDEWQWNDGAINKAALREEVSSLSPVEYLRVLEDGTQLSFARAGELRVLSCSQSRFANQNLNAGLPFGEMSRHGIGWDSFQLAFTPTLISNVYQDKVDNGSLEGGYIDINQDGNWWAPSGTPIFHRPDRIQHARDRFFLPWGSKDAFGAAYWSHMDPYSMLPIRSALSRIGFDNDGDSYLELNESIAINDYRTLTPKYSRDVNHNWSAVEVDAAGVVIKSAIMGKVAGTTPDSPPSDTAISEGDNLANPSAEMSYGFYDESSNTPAWVKSKTYTKHYFHTEPPIERQRLTSRLDFSEQIEYSDGGGNVVMSKVQTTPGVANVMDNDGNLVEVDTREREDTSRWIGNGRTIINNKGNPVKQYEPYFSATPAYEDAAELVETGISPILFYDAAGRNTCKLNPNKTYEKVVFDAWTQQSWDANDTLYLLQDDGTEAYDFKFDPDVGHIFTHLDIDEYSPGWFEQRMSGSLGPEEQRAAVITKPHVATPSIAYLDSIGRTIYTESHNRYESDQGDGSMVDEKYASETELDIEGNMLSVTDARGNKVMAYKYNMLPPADEETPKPALYQDSMDGGEKWNIPDSQGKALKSWDSRDHVFEYRYDGLLRPLESWLMEEGISVRISLSEYVDSDHQNYDVYRATNRLASVVTSYDQSGRSAVDVVDFKGNALQLSKTFALNYKTTIDWGNDLDSQLENDTYKSKSTFDALNRVILATSPHLSEETASNTKPRYNEAGALDTMNVSVRGANDDAYVQDIEYDAKGQRQFIRYGNGVQTRYEYEPDTYLLKRCVSSKGSTVLQDLKYYYDPVGNISEINDFAHAPVHFNNADVRAHNSYKYDALYRLLEASGREHATQAHIPIPGTGWDRISSNNRQALQRYIQSYQYDSVGNIQQMRHRRPNVSNTGWTRQYQYAADSNRLLATTLGSRDMPFDETYSYNSHGSITSMNHLHAMQWDFKEQLKHVEFGDQNEAHYVYDADGQRSRKVIERAGQKVKERLYIGGWEVYREYTNNNLSLERESLHVMDDQQRIALLETKTVDSTSISEPNMVVRYQLSNHLGSASIELSETADVISYEEFHPYGTTAYHSGVSDSEVSAKRYRYTGKERDEETGFSYHGARYLCPYIGRWINADPIGIADGINVYGYVSNKPVRMVDENGMAEADTSNVSYGELIPINDKLEKIVNLYIETGRDIAGIEKGKEITPDQRRMLVDFVSRLGMPRGAGKLASLKAIVTQDASPNKSKIEKLSVTHFDTKEAGFKYGDPSKGYVEGSPDAVRHGGAWMFTRQAINPSVVFEYTHSDSGTTSEIPIGTDKLGHFFAQGYEYFDIGFGKANGSQLAEAYGRSSEEGKFGLLTTGVYSNADLVANSAGASFYSDLYSDPFMTFQTNDYLSPEWNEDVNPNYYSKNMSRLLLENSNNPELLSLFDQYKSISDQYFKSGSKSESLRTEAESIQEQIIELVISNQGTQPQGLSDRFKNW